MTQYATFRVGERLLGLDLLMVREILRPLAISPVPRSAPNIRGLLNLRGQVVTILDLAVCLGLEPASLTERSHIVILKTRHDLQAGHRQGLTTQEGPTDLVGLLVDAIGDVVEADASTIEAPPANLQEKEGRLLAGVQRTNLGLLVLLNLEDLFSND
jgi:purine-binding chemotaxis protein CheW